MKKITLNIITLLLFVFLSFGVSSEIYKWIDENGKVHYGDKPKGKKIAQSIDNKYTNRNLSTLKSNTFKKGRLIGVHGKNSYNIIMKFRKLFENEKFHQLTNSLDKLSRYDVKDIKQELAFIMAFDAFFYMGPNNKALLDRWINQSPNNPFAYLARANYHNQLAWQYRGGKYAKDTNKSQFSSMKKQFSKAKSDIKKALQLNPKLIFAHYLKISMASTSDDTQRAQILVAKALKIFPLSFALRERALYFMVPKWGGSISEMHLFALDAQTFSSENPSLKILNTLSIRATADILYRRKHYKKAEVLYDEVVSKGKHGLNYFKRGRNYYRQKLYNKALNDFNKSIVFNANEAEYYYYRSLALNQLEKHESAYRDIQSAILLEPYEKRYKKRMARMRKNIPIPGIKTSSKKETSDELEKINAQITRNPGNSVLYFYRSKIFLKRSSNNRALTDLKKAIKLDPSRYQFHLLLDQMLIKQNRLDEIIASWTQYLAIKTNDSNAYLERAGTYYHKLDIENAIKDAKRAMDLGNSSAKRFYQKLIKM